MAKPRARPRTPGTRSDTTQTAIDRLVSDLGHAINNPLFAARAGVSLLTSDGCSDDMRDQLKAVEFELARIAQAMRELRARIERSLAAASHRPQLRRAKVDHQRDRTADES